MKRFSTAILIAVMASMCITVLAVLSGADLISLLIFPLLSRLIGEVVVILLFHRKEWERIAELLDRASAAPHQFGRFLQRLSATVTSTARGDPPPVIDTEETKNDAAPSASPTTENAAQSPPAPHEEERIEEPDAASDNND